MVTDGGEYLCTSADVMSGKFMSKPASIAVRSVDSAGDPKSAWINDIRFPMVACGLQWISVEAVFWIALAAQERLVGYWIA